MASASPSKDPDATLIDIVESGERITETAPHAPATPTADAAIPLNAPTKKTRFKDLTLDTEFARKPTMTAAATYSPVPNTSTLDIDEYESYDPDNVLPYSGVLLPKESPSVGVAQWPWSKRHRFEISVDRSPGAFSGPMWGASLPRVPSTRKPEDKNPTTHEAPPGSPPEVVGGGLEGLMPPSESVKRVVRGLVKAELAEEANGYILLTMVALAVGSFGGDLTPLSFWLINAVALFEVALKLLRNWSDAFVGVKCCDVASQWDAFWGLKWSIRTRALAVVVQLGLYGAEVWNVVSSDQDLGNTRDQVEKVLIAFLLLHWVFGMWVLIMELRLFTVSKIRLLLLVPGFGARRFVEVMTALALGFMACISGVMWKACVYGRWEDMAQLFDWVSDMGDNPYGTEGLPALTWYVHCKRHKMLRGYAAVNSDDCGLDVNWTMDFPELIDLFWRCHQGMIRVSPSAQKWALDGIERRVEKWATDLPTRHVKRQGKMVDIDSIGLDGLILLDAVLVIPKGQEEIFKALTPKVARLLVDKGVVARSLKATVDLACAGSDRQKELNGCAMERLAQRLMMLGEKLEDLQKWEMALTLHEAALRLRRESKAEAKGLARSLNCVAWTMMMALSDVDEPKRPPAEVEMEMKCAEENAREAVSVGEAGGVCDWDMAMHLATLAHVLKKMGRTEEEQALHEKAECLWKRSEEGEKSLRGKEGIESDQWAQSESRLTGLKRTITTLWSRLVTEADSPTKSSDWERQP